MIYEDFIDKSYKPKKTDIVCEFLLEPNGVSKKYAAGGVAAESSVGTWTELKTMKKTVESLSAKVIYMRGNKIKVSYPIELFEKGNMPNFLSSVAGNIFGLKEIKNLKLLDVDMPKKYTKSFHGPKYGIKGVRKLFNVPDRPLIGTIIKPKLGLSTNEHAKIAYESWIGGCDIVKDDENLSDQKFNKFKKRVESTLKMRDKAEKETGGKKMYLANITAETDQMVKRAEFVEDSGGEYIMVDVLTTGWSSLQTLRDKDMELIIHAHRAMHAAMTKNPKHGISMKFIAKILRIVGVDQLHVGTGVGKMAENEKEVTGNINSLTCELHGIKKTMPVASGGLHPYLVPEIIKIFDKDVIIQMGGGIHGHPKGTTWGARAARQAVDSIEENIPIDKYAKKHKELEYAIKKWR